MKEAVLRTILPFTKDIQIHIIPGNHDGADFTNNYLSETAIFEQFPEIKGLNIYPKPTTKSFNNGKDKFFLVPWIANHDKLQDLINEQHGGMILVGHMEIFGAVSSTEYTLTKGLHPKLFDKFKYVFLGHYHKHQKLAMNITYIGSPIIKDYSEIHDKDKGFIIYDSNLNEFEFYQLEKRKGFLYTITNENLGEIDAELAKNPPPEGSLIQINFTGTKEWINEVMKPILEIFNKFKPLKIKKKRTVYKEENLKSRSILILQNRVERIKKISEDEEKSITDLGIEIFRQAENEYLEVEI